MIIHFIQLQNLTQCTIKMKHTLVLLEHIIRPRAGEGLIVALWRKKTQYNVLLFPFTCYFMHCLPYNLNIKQTKKGSAKIQVFKGVWENPGQLTFVLLDAVLSPPLQLFAVVVETLQAHDAVV